MNYCGPVSISAYGDTNGIPASVQHALSSTGIALNHVPSGVKDASDKKILVDMLLWAVDNPAPANFLLISGDRDFSNALHQLRMRRYNILLAQPPHASVPLVAAAKSVWPWTSLLVGGPPLTDCESQQLGNNAYISSSNTLQNPVSESIRINQSFNSFSESPVFENHEFANVGQGIGVKCKNKPIQIKSRVKVSRKSSRPSSTNLHPQTHPLPIPALAKTLANATPEQQRTMLGESLYPLVEQLEHEMAAKVTGMLLEMDQTEVLHLLESPEALKAKVGEAMEVLRNFAQHQANSATDQLFSLSLKWVRPWRSYISSFNTLQNPVSESIRINQSFNSFSESPVFENHEFANVGQGIGVKCKNKPIQIKSRVKVSRKSSRPSSTNLHPQTHPLPIPALAKALANATPEQQRTMLGESLYPLVEQLEHEMAAKVTGMLLEMDQTEVLHLLESPEALKAKVGEAMEALRNFAQHQANSATDQLFSLSLNDNLVS